MALKFSTGLRVFCQRNGSMKQALEGGVLKLYAGVVPVAPATGLSPADAAIGSATLLATITRGSASATRAVPAGARITLTGGGAGSMNSIKVGGQEILGVVVPYNTSLTQTAADIVTQINKYISTGIPYVASSSGAVIMIYAPAHLGALGNIDPSTGTAPVVTIDATTITYTYTNMGAAQTGVSAVNGLTFGSVSSLAVLSKSSEVWSGVVAQSGTPTFFRFEGPVLDDGSQSTELIRIQGVCGTGLADYVLSGATVTQGFTHTIDQFDITFPA